MPTSVVQDKCFMPLSSIANLPERSESVYQLVTKKAHIAELKKKIAKKNRNTRRKSTWISHVLKTIYVQCVQKRFFCFAHIAGDHPVGEITFWTHIHVQLQYLSWNY